MEAETQVVEAHAGMHWEEFQQTTEWAHLTPAKRVWLVMYLATRDHIYAARTAFKPSTEKGVRDLAYQTLRNPKIVAALNKFWSRSERDLFVDELERQLKAADPGSVAAVKILAMLRRAKFGDSMAEPEEVEAEVPTNKDSDVPRFAIGTVLEQAGKRYRVEAVEVAQ